MSRISKWTAKFLSPRIKEDIDAQYELIKDNLTEYFALMELQECAVRTILTGVTPPVSVLQSPWYQAAAKEFYRITRQWVGGKMLSPEMQIAVDKWVARGLTEAVLLEIAESLFSWVPPGG